MRPYLVAALVGALFFVRPTPTAAPQVLDGFSRCRHDEHETAANGALRQRALSLAKTINTRQQQITTASGRYAPLAGLGSLPEVPAGFSLRFYGDDGGYVFAIKNTQDPCRYGIFSDQDGQVYEQTPRRPQIAGAD